MGIEVISDLVRSTDLERRQNIMLDLTCARQSVAEFAGNLNCVYVVSDVTDKYFDKKFFRNTNGRESVCSSDLFKSLTRYMHKTAITQPLSVIFVWDLFNYLKRTEIVELMSFLSPFCRPGTLLFAISWLTETIPSRPGIFELTPKSDLIFENSIEERIVSPAYSAPTIVDMMPSFQPYRLSITRLGMLEVLLQFKELIQPPDVKIIPSGTPVDYSNAHWPA